MENYLPECEKMFSSFRKAYYIIDFHVSERFFISLWELNLEVTRWKWTIFTLFMGFSFSVLALILRCAYAYARALRAHCVSGLLCACSWTVFVLSILL